MEEMRRIKMNRRKRMQQLVARFETQEALAAKLDVHQNYISRTANGKKPIGEEAARKIERKLGLEPLWMDMDPEITPKNAWPFSFHRYRWDRIPARQREEIEISLLRLMSGIEAEMQSNKRSG